jgi:hypothetical protein
MVPLHAALHPDLNRTEMAFSKIKRISERRRQNFRRTLKCTWINLQCLQQKRML